ncbi:sensor histidine kinase [Desulfosporosinus shakirovi]|uniref:sensor histidine kinase n=1 Tax=Desulfosporosinus shakirovi TaxID=2885154 RepID=UPI001E6346B3|nr:ATP-binding protein [Desulfosporosinus sp. SRJS8]MCB8816660.1 histidine kinase [Desulfosporosinus sp. SRJS8]
MSLRSGFRWISEKSVRNSFANYLKQKLKLVRVQNKILGLVVGIVILLSGMIVWEMGNILTNNLRDQLDKRAVSIGSDVAARAANQLLINNAYAVYELLQDTLKNNEDVLYIFVVDPQGNVLAHTFGEAFPKELLKANTVDGSHQFNLTVFRTEVGVVRDVAVPILNSKLGIARVGMDENSLQKAVLGMTWNLLLIALFVSALGIIAAILLTRFLTHPIRELVALTQRVTQGELDVQGVVHSQDEIGVLTNAFNLMTASLSQNYRERENLMLELREKEELRLQLLEKVMTAQEEERKRISRELHDETSQALTSLMVGLKVLEAEASFCAVGDRLQDMRQIVSQTLDEVHHLARELRPSVLDDMGLVPALERYIREYEAKYGTEVDFNVTGFQEQRIPATIEVALYRIVQEALTNVAKYAEARMVSVLLDWREDWVSAIVEDDGQGFDLQEKVSQPGRGLGLFGMQERAALLGGTFKIESQKGKGTTVFIKIPGKPNQRQGNEASHV